MGDTMAVSFTFKKKANTSSEVKKRVQFFFTVCEDHLHKQDSNYANVSVE